MAQPRDLDVQRLFHDLADLGQADREAHLRQLNVGADLAAEVTGLLAAADRAGDFLGALSQPEAARRGSIVAGRYVVEHLIGRGAMGEVYLARDSQLDRAVALKFLPTHFVQRSDAVARLTAEARAAARLDHPHVATVHDVAGGGQGSVFIVMAYYPGDSLATRVANGGMPPADACRIGAQIAAALSAAHAAGIVHRDVKPANVLFDAEGAVKLADFGVAKLAGSGATIPGAILGTLSYMSPEQARGEALDGGSDLWALGVVLYEMLTGRRPFEGEHPGALLNAILHDDAPPLPAEVRVPDEVRDLVAALLERDRSRRPASATDVVRVLGGTGGGAAMEAQGASDAQHAAPERAGWTGGVIAGALPAMLTTFVGREREIALARSLFDETRLLTFTGPGGTGKTRLALELAAAARDDFADGVWFVPLAELSDPLLVPSSIARALGIRDFGGTPIAARVLSALRDRHGLLVLDNFEHLLDAAPVVGEILAACPRITILATSRTPLALQGEQELQVPPLGTPAREEADPAGSESVRLFIQRAQSIRAGFTPAGRELDAVAEICRRLDGLPLALEMAAAWTRLLSPRALLGRLDNALDLLRSDMRDRPERHRTMRDVVDWSYASLNQQERELFDRLAIFTGGISLEAAVAMSGTGFDVHAPLELLASLCNRSLLRHEEQPDGEPRYFMLETMREFGLERLRNTGAETAARRAHRAHFLALAERAATQLRGPAQVEWFDRLECEYPNFRVALDGAVLPLAADSADRDADMKAIARLSAALHRLWLTRGPLLEGAAYLRRAIAIAQDTPDFDPRLHAELLTGAGILASTRGAYADARDLCEQALEIRRRVGTGADVAAVLNHLGWAVWNLGDLASGERMSAEAMALHTESHNELGVGLSLNNLAWIAMSRGDYARADAYFVRGLAGHRGRGDQRSAAFILGWMGFLAARMGDMKRAISLYREAVATLGRVADHGFHLLTTARLAAARHAADEPGDHLTAVVEQLLPALRLEDRRWPLASVLADVGVMWRDQGDLACARAALEEALSHRSEMGVREGVVEVRILLAGVRYAQRTSADELRHAHASLAAALRDALAYGAIPVVITGLDAAATMIMDRGDSSVAAQVRAAADRLRRELGIVLAPRYRAAHAAAWRAMEQALGDRCAEIRAGERARSVHDVVSLAARALDPELHEQADATG